ncbi:MAG: undecaprenyldiphospho-muramoylpentapeptide beta-N-acetylglucosaminyltransferase [Patescibacteria group bacterium]
MNMGKRNIRVLLTGGGTGGHIYPLVAVAEEFIKIKDVNARINYLGPKSDLNEEFERRGIKISLMLSSKLRRYFDLRNFIDVPKFFLSLLQALAKLYFLMPDVIFSKGGPGALAVVLAARFYFIPVVIHESDAVPGLTNRISAFFASKILISFAGAETYFKKSKVVFSGNPIRSGLFEDIIPLSEAKKRLGFGGDEPLILVLGGSQGSVRINNFIIDNLESLTSLAQIYHQTGINNFIEVGKAVPVPPKQYKASAYFDIVGLRQALNAADIVISRAGAGAIYEIAAFGKPSILIPLKESAGDHQRANAYEYARMGACEILEEDNFKINILITAVKDILKNGDRYQNMREKISQFFKRDAARTIAEEIIKLA